MQFKYIFTCVFVGLALIFSGCPPQQKQAESKTPAVASRSTEKKTGPTFSDAVTVVDEYGPDFALTDLQGNKIYKSDYSGDVLVLDLWATFCKSCVKKLHKYKPVLDSYRDQGVQLLAVSIDTKPDVVAGWKKEHEFPFRIAMATEEFKANYFPEASSTTVPQIAIIDRDGNLRYRFGPASTVGDLKLALSRLVEETVGGDEDVTEDVVGASDSNDTEKQSEGSGTAKDSEAADE